MLRTLQQLANLDRPIPFRPSVHSFFHSPPRLNVLLVEDNDADAFLVGEILARNPHVREVMRAEDGMKALELVRCGWFKPDLAIVDVHMPRKDGYSLLEDFAFLSEPRFPSIILTSSSRRANSWKASDCGAARVPDQVDLAQGIRRLARRCNRGRAVRWWDCRVRQKRLPPP